MTNTIKDLILGIRKLREAASKDWASYIEPIGPMSYDLEKWQAVVTPHRQTPRRGEHRDKALADSAFIAAAPTSQERLEKALEIAVGFLESIESENESMDLATSATLKDIEAALRGEK